MRVCLLTPEFLPRWGGIGAYAYNLAQGISRDVELHVVTAEDGRAWEDGPLPDGVRVHTLPAGNGVAGPSSPLRFQLAVARQLPKLIQDHGFDIVHANHAYMSDLLLRLRKVRAATVVTVHTTLGTQIGGTQRAGSRMPRTALERWVLRWRSLLLPIERLYLRRSSNVIFVSRWVQRHARQRYGIAPKVGEVIPNGVDTEFFSPAAPGLARTGADRPTILFAGRLMAQKGIGTLLDAVSRLGPDVRLLLVGPGDAAPWEGVARGYGLSRDRCHFVGRVPYAGMPDLYRQAQAVVLPSFAESCPMVALEAMASATPLVAADTGGVGEIVRDGETGWLFPPGDAGQLADRLEIVLGGSDRVRHVSAQARAWAAAFATVERMAERTLGVYERTLAEGDT